MNELNMTVKEAAAIMNKNPMYVCCGLRDGTLPFGSAVKKLGNTRYSYHISRQKFYEYMGIKKDASPVERVASQVR